MKKIEFKNLKNRDSCKKNSRIDLLIYPANDCLV